MQALAGRVAGGNDPDRPGVVHRLDRDTSGLLLLARDEQTMFALQEALRRRDITREYVALVEGRPPAKRGTIDAPLGRDRRVRTRMSTDTDDPHEAITHFEMERTFDERHAPAGHPGDRAHAPDPRPSVGDRTSRRGRPGVRPRGQARAFPAVPARAATRVQSSRDRGTHGAAGATAGGPGQGPPAGVRGTNRHVGVGEPNLLVTSRNAGVRRNFSKLISARSQPRAVSLQIRRTSRGRGSCPATDAGSALLVARDLYSSRTKEHHPWPKSA